MTGKIIESLRRSKSLTVRSLCQNIMTRSAYYRYSSGVSDTTTHRFFQMLDRVSVSLQEFQLLSNDYQEPLFFFYLKKIQHCDTFESLSQLQLLIPEIQETCPAPLKQHLVELIQLRVTALQRRPIKREQTVLFTYLTTVNNWTLYEVILFANSLWLFEDELLEPKLHCSLKLLKKLSCRYPFENEHFKLLTYALTFFLKQHRRDLFFKWLPQLEQLELQGEHLIIEKVLLTVYRECGKILKGTASPCGNPEITKILCFLEELEAVDTQVLVCMIYQDCLDLFTTKEPLTDH